MKVLAAAKIRVKARTEKNLFSCTLLLSWWLWDPQCTQLDFELMIDRTRAIFLGKVETQHCQIFTFAIDFPALESGHFSDGRSYVKSVLHHTILV